MRMIFRAPAASAAPIPMLVRTVSGATPLAWSIETWPKALPVVAPDDGREYALCAENLWDIATERLSYPAGQPFPLEERPELITASALNELHRAGLNAKGEPA